MVLKQILLLLDADAPAETASSLAATIASGSGGRVEGVCLFRQPDPTTAECFAEGPEGVGDVIEHLRLEIRERTASASESFQHAVASRGLSDGWSLAALDDWRGVLTGPSRIADLVVATAAQSRHDFRRVTVDLLLQSGAPWLIAPPRPSPRAPLRRVAMAWNGSREAARAMRDGMAFLAAASDVIVIVAAEEKTAWIDQASTDRLLTHLARHGVHPELVRVASQPRLVGQALIAQCKSFRADLLVMGAFGHSRASETILGGATQTMLERAPCAVLMSH